MNLTEEKKGPLRSMPIQQKKMMLEKFFQSKGTGRVYCIVPDIAHCISLLCSALLVSTLYNYCVVVVVVVVDTQEADLINFF